MTQFQELPETDYELYNSEVESLDTAVATLLIEIAKLRLAVETELNQSK